MGSEDGRHAGDAGGAQSHSNVAGLASDFVSVTGNQQAEAQLVRADTKRLGLILPSL